MPELGYKPFSTRCSKLNSLVIGIFLFFYFHSVNGNVQPVTCKDTADPSAKDKPKSMTEINTQTSVATFVSYGTDHQRQLGIDATENSDALLCLSAAAMIGFWGVLAEANGSQFEKNEGAAAGVGRSEASDGGQYVRTPEK